VTRAGGAAVAAPTLDALRGRVASILARDGVPGAGLVLASASGVVWAGGVGVADRGTGRPVTADTVFRLGSVTKSLVALAVMQLVEAGRLSLDDPLRRLAPEVSFENPWESTDPVRLAQLLEHTAGFEFLRCNEDVDRGAQPRSLRAALAVNPRSRRSRWRPGTRMSYSNEGYLAAGYVLEKVTGRSVDDLVRDRILAPLGMRTAALRRTPETDADRATGYRGGAETPYRDDMIRPAANLLASPADMGRYLLLWLRRGEVDGHRLLSADGIARIERRRTLPYAGPAQQYGLGNQAEQYGGHVAHGHSGFIHGFVASFRYLPREGVGWAVMLNSSDGGGALRDIERELLDLLTRGRRPAVPVSAPTQPGGLDRLAGVYRNTTPLHALTAPLTALFDDTRFELRQGALWERSTASGGPRSLLQRRSWHRLTAAGEGGFRRDGEAISSLHFTRTEQGRWVLVTPDGYRERTPGWLVAAERGLVAAGALCLLSAAVPAGLWLLSGVRRGRRRDHGWVRVVPAVAGGAAISVYALVVRAPQPLGEVNRTTVAILLLSVASPALYAVALGQALRLPTAEVGLPAKAHLSAVTSAGVGLAALAGRCGWVGLRTWSW
jgi:CubicO group peptidase (beta-lactamase class C family)